MKDWEDVILKKALSHKETEVKEEFKVLDNVLKETMSSSKYITSRAAYATIEDVKNHLHVLVGAMILDGYEVEDSCVKFVNEYIERLDEKQKEISNNSKLSV